MNQFMSLTLRDGQTGAERGSMMTLAQLLTIRVLGLSILVVLRMVFQNLNCSVSTLQTLKTKTAK